MQPMKHSTLWHWLLKKLRFELNLLAIVFKRQKWKVPRNDGGAEISEAEQNLPINDRVLYSEMKWFAGVLKEATPSFHVVKVYILIVI
jgi:hypothetical protein